jgi:succinate-semialdehyde dehydrogenase/glutarate-semialdehyde dehydrogenase
MTQEPRVIRTINPATGEPLAEYPAFSAAQIEEALGATAAAGAEWAAVPVEQRAELLGATGRLLRERREELAHLITTEMGKPLPEALAEVDKCAWQCDYYSTDGPSYLQPEEIGTTAQSSYVTY